jgi:hypothetical protein
MKCRDLLKAIPASAKIPASAPSSALFFGIPDNRKVIAFVDASAELLLNVVRKTKLPVEVTVVPVRVPEGKTIDDAVRLYITDKQAGDTSLRHKQPAEQDSWGDQDSYT